MLKLILCLDNKNGMAKNGSIPWKIQDELEHFKNVTSSHIVVMGRITFETMKKPLADRKNIIFSNTIKVNSYNIETSNDISYIIKLSKEQDVFIVGGKKLAMLFMPYIDEIILSKINKSYQCDLFININLDKFICYESKDFEDYSIAWYKRIDSKVLYGTELVYQKLIFLKQKSKNLYETNKILPTLAIIVFNDSFENDKYILAKKKMASVINVTIKIYSLNLISLDKFKDIIINLNNDKNIHGILVQHPFPKSVNIQPLFSLIDHKKDVDCFTSFNINNIWFDNKENSIIFPCTAQAIVNLLKFYKIKISGKRVVIVGRSIIVGRPLFLMLLNENATVTICHSKTINLKSICLEADILICAIGKPYFFDDSYIKENAIVIDVGINKTKQETIVGDVNFHKAYNKVKYITPVPKGIGPLTVVELFHNLLNLYELQYSKVDK